MLQEDGPRHMLKAIELAGIQETVGPKHNPVIMGWAKELGLQGIYTSDEIPWCGLFVATCIHRAGREIVKDPLWALNWAKFGDHVSQPMFGDVLTFKRQGGGHVGFYVAEDSTAYHVFGGNQGNKVCPTRIEKARLYEARRPQYTNQPHNVRKILLDASGEISKNEA
jgi:uncharacterized protein (TIGR02594 family)